MRNVDFEKKSSHYDIKNLYEKYLNYHVNKKYER